MATRDVLLDHITQWTDRVRKISIGLYDNGAAPEHVLKLAIQIADSQMQREGQEKAERASRLSLAPGVGSSGN